MKLSLYFNGSERFYPTFLLISIQQKILIDIGHSYVIIMVEYEIIVHKSVLSAVFRNKVSAFFIFDNTILIIDTIKILVSKILKKEKKSCRR